VTSSVSSLLQLVITNMGGQISANNSVAFPASITDSMKKWAYYVIDYNQVCYLIQTNSNLTLT
jgi:hypothetical protein